ncbi:acyl-CoA dehydrogenase family protein [Spongiactinospora sp. TRM90649]|uniref:acyl-CoA dehydrogenase family protein n=1 Tax=Spongiactinospora sp. TRM90649 TaxID=3031114 RepID=UPI0023F7321B|nr:acyl-CoA dehydrogenase family protein [Spongiactinospora sp. TRM90649]MDF5753560.1 acyl-CoA dehydrogenase family protein [Spongiactinospora sp. TRM90649]
MHSLTDVQDKLLREYRRFVQSEIEPHVNVWDQEGRVPREVITSMADQGFMGALIPAEYGGSKLNMIEFGLLNEAIGYGCSSIRSVLTVHSMVSQAVTRWGTQEQRAAWLPRLARGEWIGAFALSEAGAGSDVAQIGTVATADGDDYVLDGVKRWITYGQGADVFLVFARSKGRYSAFVVERDTPGLTVSPIDGMLGTRASMIAELRFENCRVPRSALLGRAGFGLAPVASAALDIGRYSVGWGSIGLAQSCLELSLGHARERRAFGVPILDHQLVQRLVTDMATGVSAARLLGLQAGELVQAGDSKAVAAVWMAKYFASTTAMRSASDTVQIFGAHGCDPAGSPQRLFRDAKVMEIIEGSTQIQQTMIARLIPSGES